MLTYMAFPKNFPDSNTLKTYGEIGAALQQSARESKAWAASILLPVHMFHITSHASNRCLFIENQLQPHRWGEGQKGTSFPMTQSANISSYRKVLCSFLVHKYKLQALIVVLL